MRFQAHGTPRRPRVARNVITCAKSGGHRRGGGCSARAAVAHVVVTRKTVFSQFAHTVRSRDDFFSSWGCMTLSSGSFALLEMLTLSPTPL